MGVTVSKEISSKAFAYCLTSTESNKGIFSQPHRLSATSSSATLNHQPDEDGGEEASVLSRQYSFYKRTDTDDDSEEEQEVNQIVFSQLSNTSTIGLCSQGLVKLTSNIGFLENTCTTLQLCCNHLTKVPQEIGSLTSLTSLSLAKNQLTSVPDSISLLIKLVELKLNDNLLTFFPPKIFNNLSKLAILTLENNKLQNIPHELGMLKSLHTLDLSNNPITTIPAEIGSLKYLRRLIVDHCPLLTTDEDFPSSSVLIPSLKELAARIIVREQLQILNTTSQSCISYLSSASQCSFCQGPYFDTFHRRFRFIEKNDADIPLEYRLCVSHWVTEEERITQLFCPTPDTAPSSVRTTPVVTPQRSRSLRIKSTLLSQHNKNNEDGANGNQSSSIKERNENVQQQENHCHTNTTNIKDGVSPFPESHLLPLSQVLKERNGLVTLGESKKKRDGRGFLKRVASKIF